MVDQRYFQKRRKVPWKTSVIEFFFIEVVGLKLKSFLTTKNMLWQGCFTEIFREKYPNTEFFLVLILRYSD